MTITDIITQFFVVLLGLLLFFLIKNFWPKYFETKGANQATKEDIGEITKIVEDIKAKLSQETELLKAHISLTNQHKLNIKSAEREALIDLNRKASAWLYYLVRFEFTNYNRDTYMEMEREKVEFKKRQYEYDLAQAHLNLFMHDQALLLLIRDFSVTIIKYENRLSKGILELKHIFATQILKTKGSDPTLKTIEEHHNEFMTFYDKYRSESLELFRIADKAHTALVKLLNKRLRELEESETDNSG